MNINHAIACICVTQLFISMLKAVLSQGHSFKEAPAYRSSSFTGGVKTTRATTILAPVKVADQVHY